MSDPVTDSNLWAGITGIPFLHIFALGEYKAELNGRTSLYGKVSDQTSKLDFSALKKILNSDFPDTKSPEDVAEYFSLAALDSLSDLFSARATLKGKMVLKNENGEVIESDIDISSTSDRSGKNTFTFRFTVTGFTACPCSMDSVKEKLKSQYPEYEEAIGVLPGITHNQRILLTLVLSFSKTPGSVSSILLDTARETIGNLLSYNSPGHDSDILIIKAHRNPMLIEDVARKGAEVCRKNLTGTDGLESVTVRAESFESIHPYNVKSEKTVTFNP